MRHFLILFSACTTVFLTGTLTSALYATNRDVTTAALSTITRTVLETLYPVDNSTAPFPPTLQPLDRRYIDTLFRRHLGHGVTPTYLRVVESVADANEYIMAFNSGRNSNKFWHRYIQDGKLSMNISDRYVSEWKAAAVKAINTSQHYEARMLIGQALHIVQDGHQIPGGNGSLTQSAVEAAEGFLRDVLGQVSTSLMRDFLGIHGQRRGREIVVVVDNTFKNHGGVDRLRAVARWAADFAASSSLNDVPHKFTIYFFGSDYSVYPAQEGQQSITELMNRMVENCLADTTTNPVCPETTPSENLNVPRDILYILDKAARRAEVGATIALFTNARFSTNQRLHAPLLQKKDQQLIIVGDPELREDREKYINLVQKTGGTLVFAGSNQNADEIYQNIGFLHHAAKENLVVVEAVDFVQNDVIEREVALLPGDIAAGIQVGPLDVQIDIDGSGKFQYYPRGSWVNAPANLTNTWKFRVKNQMAGLIGESFQAYIQSDIFHNMGIYQYLDLTQSTSFFNRLWQHKGFARLLGNPSINTNYSILLTTPQCENCESQPVNIELIGERGNVVESATATAINNQYLAAAMRIPFQPFRIVVSGMFQGKPYKRFSPRLITPTNHPLEIEWYRPIDVMTPDARTVASLFYTAPENSTARLETKEYLSYFSSMTRWDHPSKDGNKYKFNVTVPDIYQVTNEQPVDEMVFVVLSENEGISGDNYIVQHVSVIDGVRPFSPSCTVIESTHGKCASNSACDNRYDAKMRIVDDYDGFQYQFLETNIRETWSYDALMTMAISRMAVDTDGKFAVTVDVKNAKCCETAGVIVTDANYESYEVCSFRPTAGASGITGVVTWIMAIVLLVFLN